MSNRKPNFIFVMTDEQNLRGLSCYRGTVCQTPSVDRLADEGVLFDTVHAASPWTAPSFGSIFTGVSPTVHGAGGMMAQGNPRGISVLGVTVGGIRKDLPTLAELMPEKMTTAGFITNAFVSEALGMARTRSGVGL